MTVVSSNRLHWPGRPDIGYLADRKIWRVIRRSPGFLWVEPCQLSRIRAARQIRVASAILSPSTRQAGARWANTRLSRSCLRGHFWPSQMAQPRGETRAEIGMEIAAQKLSDNEREPPRWLLKIQRGNSEDSRSERVNRATPEGGQRALAMLPP